MSVVNLSNLPSRIPRIYAFKDNLLSVKFQFPVGYDVSNITAKLFYNNKYHQGAATITVVDQLVTATLSRQDFIAINLPLFDLYLYNSEDTAVIGATIQVDNKSGNPVNANFEVTLPSDQIVTVEVVDYALTNDAAVRAETAATQAIEANDEIQTVLPSLQTDISSRVPKTTTVNGKALNTNISLNKSDVGIPNVDNTSDVNKPVSTLQQAALDLKVPNTRTINSKPLSEYYLLCRPKLKD